MLKRFQLHFLLLILILVTAGTLLEAQQRFPKPEFDSGYVQPDPTTPEPRSVALEYFDVIVLFVVLSLASWLAVRKRSRKGLLWLSVFSLIYFGFYRDGCICSIGAIQNVALSIFDKAYTISLAALLFFLLPLLFALFFGRVFCASACPLEGTALSRGMWERPEVNAEACLGCGLCERSCIRYPQAIRVKPEGA